ncbi:MAG: deoxyribose-phosphate aldolase [Aureispira sp.]
MIVITRNTPQPFLPALIQEIRVDTIDVEQKKVLYSGNSPMNRPQKIEQLLLALRCMDLTTLSGDDTMQRVEELCALAQQPLPEDPMVQVGAVCLYPAFVATAKAALEGSSIPVASVAAGFPTGLLPLSWRLAEIRGAVAAGAAEIDIVAPRHYSLSKDWEGLYKELLSMREACGGALLKVILETGHLPDLETIAGASRVAILAGADFIKTSTGKEAVGATLEAGIVMAQQIRAHEVATGLRVGLKPAGGIRRAQQALQWLMLVQKELGTAWEDPRYFRIGASSLLTAIQTELKLLRTEQ